MRIMLIFLLLLPLVTMADGLNADSALLKKHVYALSGITGSRNMEDTAALDAAARYILGNLHKATPNVYTQMYGVKDKAYGNIIAGYGPKDAPRIIIGAHYDVCEKQPGADDNGSGVAALLELARLLATQPTDKWKYRVDLVAYTLEEPPAFRTNAMGSAVHAKSMADSNVQIKGMISIEMIGFYKNAKHTQRYPAGILKLFYGSRANYITVVRKLKAGRFTRQFTRHFKHGDNIITKVFSAPRWVPGIDFSDHLNYWANGWDALMITDTSFYRNANYHEATDTPDTLDYARMSYVVSNMFHALAGMAQ